MDEDRDLPPESVSDEWLAELIRCMRRDPSYQPHPLEVLALRHALARERERRRRAQREGQRLRPLPRRRRSSVPTPNEIVWELLASPEFQAAVALLWAALDAARSIGTAVAVVAVETRTRRVRGPR